MGGGARASRDGGRARKQMFLMVLREKVVREQWQEQRRPQRQQKQQHKTSKRRWHLASASQVVKPRAMIVGQGRTAAVSIGVISSHGPTAAGGGGGGSSTSPVTREKSCS